MSWRLVIATVVAATTAGCAGTPTPESSIVVAPREFIFAQAHRGSTKTYPELTMAAFAAAVEGGADRLEMDLALTSDGHIVLMHDATVNRTTDGSGRVDSLSLAEIKALDAGSWHSSGFVGERVPTLCEVIQLVNGRTELNLEIKVTERSSQAVRRTIEAATDLVAKLGASSWVVYSSFDSRALLAVRDRVPNARLILLDWRPPSRYDGLDVAIDNEFHGWSPSSRHISEARVHRARRAGLSVHVGASLEQRVLEFIRWGVDGLSSGDPQSLVAFLENEGYREGSERGRLVSITTDQEDYCE